MAAIEKTFPVAPPNVGEYFHLWRFTDIAARWLRSPYVPGMQGHAARVTTLRGLMMQNDHVDRTDLHRMADDGCPHVPDRDTKTHDLSALWGALGKDDQGGE